MNREYGLELTLIEDRMMDLLRPRYPTVVAHVGYDLRAECELIYAQRNLTPPPLDWISFSFPSKDMWDAHVGVVLSSVGDRTRCRVGFHASSPLWSEAAETLRTLPWPRPKDAHGFSFMPEADEWQLVEEFEFPALDDAQLRHLTDSATAYYGVASVLL